MALSFLELGLSPVDIQQAAQSALQEQVTKNRAVLPRANLTGAVRGAMQRRRAGQGLALEQEKLRIAKDAAQYQQGQLPLEVATGVLSGALGVYGGVRAQQAARRQETFGREALGLQQQTIQQQAEATRQQVDQYGRIRRALEGRGYPPSYFAPGP